MTQLEEMNERIKELQTQRKTWLDNNYLQFAKFAIGDKIYAEIAADQYRMRPAGVVKRVYAKHDLESEHFNIFYEFTKHPNYPYGNNTEGGRSFSFYYTQADWERHTKQKIRELEDLL